MRHHLVADVPVGVFLSAGIDSNVVAALAAEQNSRLRTVTLAFDEYAGTDMDEAPLADEAARILGSDHTTIRIGRGEFEALLDDFLRGDGPALDRWSQHLSDQSCGSRARLEGGALGARRRRAIRRLSLVS